MSSERCERLLRDLCALSGWDRAHAMEVLSSVLCGLDQIVFYNGRQEMAPIYAPFRLLRRCPHHRGVRPQSLSRQAFIRMVSADLDLSLHEAEVRIRQVFSALEHQLSESERFQVRQWLPKEVLSFWPSTDNAALQT